MTHVHAMPQKIYRKAVRMGMFIVYTTTLSMWWEKSGKKEDNALAGEVRRGNALTRGMPKQYRVACT